MASTAPTLPPLPLPKEISQSFIECAANGLTFHILEAGYTAERSKPLLLLLHGYPELAFSWRKVILPLAAAGYYVVAPDQRGYGRTTGWDTSAFSDVDLSQFTMTNLVRDMVVLVNALGYKKVHCVIGHDFGSVSAASCALVRPDIFESVAVMSHPFGPPPAVPFNTRNEKTLMPNPAAIMKDLAALSEPRKHYSVYNTTTQGAHDWDNPAQGLREFLRGYVHIKSADHIGNDPHPLKAWEAAELAKMPHYYIMPLHSSMPEVVASMMEDLDPTKTTSWMPEEDLDVYVQEWTRTGFRGGLNWYRAQLDPKQARDMQLFSGKKIEVPALFIAANKDWGNHQRPGDLEMMSHVCTDLRGIPMVEGAGHWPQQEKPERVAEEILSFLQSL